MQKIPHVAFVHAPIAQEVDMLGYFIVCDWAMYVFKRHPGLRAAARITNEQKRMAEVKKYVTTFRREQKNELEKARRDLQKMWSLHEKHILPTLQKLIGTDWPKSPRVLRAYVSINPICPRFLSSWSFAIGYGAHPSSRVRRIVTHEIAHFLHFKKWKEMFPDADPRTFEQPHRAWLLSELAAVSVLNDSRVQRYIGEREKSYSEHRKIKIAGKAAPVAVNALYQKIMRAGKTYEDFLKEAAKLLKNVKT